MRKRISPFDRVAAIFDQTSGGEARGDYYADALHRRVPQDTHVVVEVGIGTGVVALGLLRRGKQVVGLDLSAQMLAKAKDRLGQVVVLGDGCRLPFRTESVNCVVSVWMVHLVSNPTALFREAYRILRPGGRYLVCPTHRPFLSDRIGLEIGRMFRRLQDLSTSRYRSVSARPGDGLENILEWGQDAGFIVHIEKLRDQQWESSPEQEIAAIRNRNWGFLVDLDDNAFETISGPTIAALQRMPPGSTLRKAIAHIAVLDKPTGKTLAYRRGNP